MDVVCKKRTHDCLAKGAAMDPADGKEHGLMFIIVTHLVTIMAN
jgi:hypothetical protein